MSDCYRRESRKEWEDLNFPFFCLNFTLKSMLKNQFCKFTAFTHHREPHITAANVALSCPIYSQIPLSFSLSSINGLFAPHLVASR